MARNDKGQFIKGTSGNPAGRPSLAAEAPVREGIKAAVSAEKVAQVLDRLHSEALHGDVRAAQLFLEYALGKPQQHLDLTSGGGDKLKVAFVWSDDEDNGGHDA